MFKKIFAAVSVATLVAPLAFAAAPIQFADTPWGATKAQTKEKLVAAGLTFDKEDEDGDLQFSGTMPIVEEPAVVLAFFAPGDSLVKVQVNIFAPESRVLKVYQSMKDALTGQFGAPRRNIEQYSYPFDSGAAGYETTAIRFGKGIVATLWGNGGPDGGLALTVTDQLLDQINYESGFWMTELERRKKAANAIQP